MANENFYDSNKFGVIERHWFGLTKKAGGDAANGFTFGTTDATTGTFVERFYPKGPIEILKIGAQVLATMTNASNDLVPVRFVGRGASASAMGDFYPKSTSSAAAPWSIASRTPSAGTHLRAGEYIHVRYATPRTDNGTAANTATTTGSVALFMDYRRKFVGGSGKWNT